MPVVQQVNNAQQLCKVRPDSLVPERMCSTARIRLPSSSSGRGRTPGTVMHTFCSTVQFIIIRNQDLAIEKLSSANQLRQGA